MKSTNKTHERQGNAPVPPPPCKRRLQSAQDVRVFLADVANRVNRNEIDTTTAKTLGYLMQILNSVITASDLEARLIALEDAKENRK